MPCLLALFAAFFPRVALLIVWLARPIFITNAFGNSFLVPVLGIIFLPFTTLFYVLFYRAGVGVAGWEWVWIGIAFLIDLSHWFGTYTQRSAAARYTGGVPT